MVPAVLPQTLLRVFLHIVLLRAQRRRRSPPFFSGFCYPSRGVRSDGERVIYSELNLSFCRHSMQERFGLVLLHCPSTTQREWVAIGTRRR